MMLRIPRFFIVVGAMKAGTSFLYDLLRDHPRIETLPIKEVNYLPHLYTDYYNITHGLRLHHLKVYSAHCEIGRSVQQIQKDVGFFSRYLCDPVDDRWFRNLYASGPRTYKAEFSNIASILEPSALRRVRKLARRMRIVYIIRDPLLRLWSHVKFHNSVDWREGKAVDLAQLSAAGFDALFHEFGHHQHGQYADNIRRLRSVFDPSELQIVFYEDLVADARRTLEAICAFMGLSPHHPPAERLATPVNVGPSREMPDAFIEAARPFVRHEFEALPALGVQPHAAWRAP